MHVKIVIVHSVLLEDVGINRCLITERAFAGRAAYLLPTHEMYVSISMVVFLKDIFAVAQQCVATSCVEKAGRAALPPAIEAVTWL